MRADALCRFQAFRHRGNEGQARTAGTGVLALGMAGEVAAGQHQYVLAGV